MSFKVIVQNFEGPIDALLQLIEKKKVPISEVSLGNIADEYMQFVKSIEGQGLSDTTYFLLVASTLTLIKSKSLLPDLFLSEEEEEDVEGLKLRLELFKIYRDASIAFKHEFSTGRKFHYPKPRVTDVRFLPHEVLTTERLRNSLESVLSEVPKQDDLRREAHVKIAIHIDEMMQSLEARIKDTLSISFQNFLEGHVKDGSPGERKVYQVIGFLAMLELVRGGVLDVLQDQNFSDIAITSATN